MGDLIGDIVDSELYYVPRAEFDRVARLNATRAAVKALYANMARLNALYMIARAGSGHIGSSFSALDLLAHLYLEELNEHDRFFSSKGHDAPALYAILIAQGVLAEEKLHKLRRLGGLPGHPDVSVPGLVANTGSLGMGISKAKGMILANRMRGRKARVFVMTGDGELQEGQIWESLVSAANIPLGELTVIVDHNKFQSDYSVERTSSLGDLAAKFEAFGWRVARVDGHDHEACASALKALDATQDAPKVLIADTVKGRGVSFMEGTAIDSDVDMFRYHSGAPKADEYQRAVAEIETHISRALEDIGAAPIEIKRVERPTIAAVASGARQHRLIGAYSRALMQAAKARPELVALDADLALDMGLLEFAAAYPERFFECGIAEQDMVSQAGGLALGGFLPVVHSFACFLSTRPNEQIYNNATERTQIIYVAGLAGVLPAGPGHSHQSVRDISAVGGVPGLVMVEPCCEEETALLFDWCLAKHRGPSYLRLISAPYATAAELPPDYAPAPGRGVALRGGRDGVIIASGLIMVAEALEAASMLAKAGLDYGVVNLPWLNTIDPLWLAELCADAGVLVTLDNHYRRGGQGQMVLAALAQLDIPKPRCLTLGLDDVPPSGRNEEVLAAIGLDAASIARAVAAFHKRAL